MRLSAEMRENVGRLNVVHDVSEYVEKWANRAEILERTVCDQKEEITRMLEDLIGLRTASVRLREDCCGTLSKKCLETARTVPSLDS